MTKEIGGVILVRNTKITPPLYPILESIALSMDAQKLDVILL